MKPVLFIDRDGTLIREPADEQIDSFDKLEFYPGVFSNLKKICEELNYEIVMITNQDGLGTNAYPESSFWQVHNFMLDAFKNEGIVFDNQLIDRTFAKDNAPTRKPRTGLLTAYFSEVYDLKNSFVIGDRLTDIELAKNVGCQGIFMNDETHLGINEISVKQEELTPYISLETNSWEAIYTFLKAEQRMGKITRNTNETKIDITLNLDGTGKSNIDTGIAFFDHMLDQITRHGQIDLDLKVIGDLEVDEHHTIEDTAIALGNLFHTVLGSKLGIENPLQATPI